MPLDKGSFRAQYCQHVSGLFLIGTLSFLGFWGSGFLIRSEPCRRKFSKKCVTRRTALLRGVALSGTAVGMSALATTEAGVGARSKL